MTRLLKNISIGTLAIGMLAGVAHAQEGSAEGLVANMQRADMTYQQLMEIMGTASGMMHEGILRQNQQMVKNGAEMILTHPAPRHDP